MVPVPGIPPTWAVISPELKLDISLRTQNEARLQARTIARKRQKLGFKTIVRVHQRNGKFDYANHYPKRTRWDS